MDLYSGLENLIRKLKREPSYTLSRDYTAWEHFSIVFDRGIQALRGLILRVVRLHRSRLPVFAGRRIELRGTHKIRSGPCLILENDVSIRALSTDGVVLGRNVTLARLVTLQTTGVIARPGRGIVLGNSVAIGAASFLGGQGGLSIGDDTILGPAVKIFTEDHDFGSEDCPIRLQGEQRKPVNIGANCWIGSGAIILAGSVIGDGSVIGAGAVVKGEFPANSLIVGCPARVLRSRIDDRTIRREFPMSLPPSLPSA